MDSVAAASAGQVPAVAALEEEVFRLSGRTVEQILPSFLRAAAAVPPVLTDRSPGQVVSVEEHPALLGFLFLVRPVAAEEPLLLVVQAVPQEEQLVAHSQEELVRPVPMVVAAAAAAASAVAAAALRYSSQMPTTMAAVAAVPVSSVL